jgi:arylsulfatase A-like enzyme/Tfp pilus assembly protein PilF
MNKVIGVLVLACFLIPDSGFSAVNQRNVILITIDTMRADYWSCNGSTDVKTPNLDRLANEGVNFQRVRTPVPLTLPSHASILTSLYPRNHGIRDNAIFQLDESHLTFAEILKKYGYRTAAFVGSFVLDPRFGLNQGFDYYDAKMSGGAEMLERPDAERSAEQVYDSFARWLQQHQDPKPVFVWLHFYDPHAPYDPPVSFKKQYRSNPYASEVAFTDSIIGKVITELQTRKMIEQSIVAVVGDHGEGLGQHQETTHSILIYNSTLHVPMLISAPGLIPAGMKLNELSSTIDLVPTLLDYLAIPEKMGEGKSLRSMIENKGSTAKREAVSESLYPRFNLGWSELYGIEFGNYHYILAPNPELYDVAKDPAEKQNIIGSSPKIAQDLRQKLESNYVHSAVENPESPVIDPEVREKMESLGYVSGSSAATSGKSSIDPKTKMEVWNQIQVGLYQFSQNQYQSAVKTFEKILTTEKQTPLIFDYLGSSYMRLGNEVQAEKCYEAAIKAGIDSAVFHQNLGVIHFHRKENDQAIVELQKAISLDDLNVNAHYQLGEVYRVTGNLGKAAGEYERALELNPSYVYAKNGLGRVFAAMKRDTEALDAFQEVVRLDPEGAPGYFNLAVQFERMKRFKEAMASYQKFLKVLKPGEMQRERERATEAIARLKMIQ